MASDLTVIFASGSSDDSPEIWQQFSRIEISELEQDQAGLLVAKLLGAKAAKGFFDRASRLPRNPMLLTLAALLKERYATSLNAVLYQEFVLALLKKRIDVGLLPGRLDALVGFLSAFANAGDTSNIDLIADLADRLGLSPTNTLGLARREAVDNILIASGVITRRGGRLEFIHQSFRSYFRSEHLAALNSPQNTRVWDRISPFREGWDTITFVCEIWLRDGQSISTALMELLAFGDRGLRTISALASRSPDLPLDVTGSAVAKWMYRNDDFWEPGYIDGPVQQLTLIASSYESGREALRTIAGDTWTYQEDASYAARGLAEVGLATEARDVLVLQCRDRETYSPHRILAAEILLEVGFKKEACDCLKALKLEWDSTPPDGEYALILLGKVLYQTGQKRAALSLLKRLTNELTEELELQSLSETYADLGFMERAAKLARRAFDTMEWSRDATRGIKYRAIELGNLLDRVGAKREASFIRKHIALAEDADIEELEEIALDLRKNADQRLASAKELGNRGLDQVALHALELLVDDTRTPLDVRFSAITPMLNLAGGLNRVCALLTRIVKDEPGHKVACGTALVSAGLLAEGYGALRQVALEPAETPERRIGAIRELARLGRLDLAGAGFRKLSVSQAIPATKLKFIAETFAYTPFWSEFLEICDWLFRNSDSASVRIRAIEILAQTQWLNKNHSNADNVLRGMLVNQNASVEDRMDAAYALSKNRDREQVDLLFDITTSPDETMEAGLAAVEALYVMGEHFAALDGGHDVVWDKKLSLDQFIEAAHRFLRIADHINAPEYPSDLVESAMAEELVNIARDPKAPLERRLAAARVDVGKRTGVGLDAPFWQGVRAVIDDTATPLSDRWIAIRYAVKCDPALMERFRPLVESDSLGPLQAAEIFRAAKWLDHAAERYHMALSGARTLGVRLDILTRLASLNEGRFAGRAAADALNEYIFSKMDCEFNSSVIEQGLSLARLSLSQEELLALALEIANSSRVGAYEIRPALQVACEIAGEAAVHQILKERLKSAAACTTKGLNDLLRAYTSSLATGLFWRARRRPERLS